jgi:hypothetical protein
MYLNQLHPRFRQLTDLLCFSDIQDLNVSEYRGLLRANLANHSAYLWDRLTKCTEIAWENGSQFWAHRFALLLELNDKKLLARLEEHVEKRAHQLIRAQEHLDPRYDIEYLQFVELCKAKRARGHSLDKVKQYLLNLPCHCSFDKMIGLVQSFIPMAFSDLQEYATQLAHRIESSMSHFDVLLAMEKHGFALERQPIAQVAFQLIMERPHNTKSCRTFLYLLDDAQVTRLLKQEYQASHRDKLLALLEHGQIAMLERNKFAPIKSLLELDASLTEDLFNLYATKVYERDGGHKTANADKLIKLTKACPNMSPRKIVSFLSKHSKLKDLKYIVASFPELKKLSAFV